MRLPPALWTTDAVAHTDHSPDDEEKEDEHSGGSTGPRQPAEIVVVGRKK